MNFPTPRHKNCEDNRCKICFTDSMELDDYLKQRIKRYKIDYSGEYHWWLKNIKHVNPETPHGWWSEDAFNKKYADEFIKFFNQHGHIPLEKCKEFESVQAA